MPRTLRSTSVVPASRSSAAICCDTADCVNESASAAAEKEPRWATSRRTRMRRTSSIRTAYTNRRQASFALMPGAPHNPPMTNRTHRNPTVVIRAARGSDGPALAQLALLDSQAPLRGDALVAERDGELVAALAGGRAIADPFVPTADL